MMKFAICVIFPLILIACDEEASPSPNRSKVGETRSTTKHSGQADKQKDNGDAGKQSKMPFEDSLVNMDNAAIVAGIKQRISSNDLKPNSEGAERVKLALIELLKRKSSEFYELLSLLPPGYHSEMIVSGVFGESSYSSASDLLEASKAIAEPDLLKAALNGGLGALQKKGGKSPVDIKIGVLEGLQKQGLTHQNFANLLLEGHGAGTYTQEDVARNVKGDDTIVMLSMSKKLTPEQLKDWSVLVYQQGGEIAGPYLRAMSRQMVISGPPEDAVNWAQRLPEDAGRMAVDGIFSEWLSADPISASKYLAGMEAGLLRDTSVSALIRNCVTNNDYANALTWLDQIKDQKIRADSTAFIQKSQNRPTK